MKLIKIVILSLLWFLKDKPVPTRRYQRDTSWKLRKIDLTWNLTLPVLFSAISKLKFIFSKFDFEKRINNNGIVRLIIVGTEWIKRKYGLDNFRMVSFHMTSRRPYCFSLMKRRPCWCSRPGAYAIISMSTVSNLSPYLCEKMMP